MTARTRTPLKQDTFGAIYACRRGVDTWIERDTATAAWWARPLARWLLRREARALGRLRHHTGVTKLRSVTRSTLTREFLPGEPLFRARPTTRDWFRAARKHLHAMHRSGVTHNDLAKEPNWLVRPDGGAAIMDFQLASVFKRRTTVFRWQAREDIRHFLKHKRTYIPESLTMRERHILATPSPASRLYRATIKRFYLWLTRRVLHWSDREGAGDRGRKD